MNAPILYSISIHLTARISGGITNPQEQKSREHQGVKIPRMEGHTIDLETAPHRYAVGMDQIKGGIANGLHPRHMMTLSLNFYNLI